MQPRIRVWLTVRAAIRCTNGICTVEHTHQEDEPIGRIPNVGRPVFPHKSVAGMPTASSSWHHCAYHNSDEDSSEDEEEPQIIDCR